MFICWRNINSKIFLFPSLPSIVIMMEVAFGLHYSCVLIRKTFWRKTQTTNVNVKLLDLRYIFDNFRSKHPNWSLIFLLVKSLNFWIYCRPKFLHFFSFVLKIKFITVLKFADVRKFSEQSCVRSFYCSIFFLVFV